ncbi:hypothetical protein BA953_00855 [Vibrio coralliilyticus]|uniref:DotU family type IV/VI secretion system protein n=1 Tax=Vibrio coralliilyticus TaxID=190893 RepID=UPI00081097F1|nr:DotU family type IV/VI secretion system protein [Vibrio coralliilyticus]ANW22863.1 hypothetical protein BA953_00855 [Vibrio coralliilyticus]
MKEPLIRHFMATTAAIAENKLTASNLAVLSEFSQRCCDLESSIKDSNNPWDEDVLFALYVWADEHLNASEWAKDIQWVPLQTRYFKTSCGGELFFSRLDDLVSQYTNAHSVEKQNLIKALRVYALCLRAGFKGKHYDNDEHELKTIKHKLIEIIGLKTPPLNSNALENTGSKKRELLINSRGWGIRLVLGACLVIALFLVYRELLFQQLTS